MRYLIKSRAAKLVIRDGVGKGAPMREVGPVHWVEFAHLPANTSEDGDADVLVRKLDAELAAQGEMVTAPEGDPPPVEANVDPEQAPPKKSRRGRRE
jgi:hypothetical protein